jgi:hypothetical protein
MGSHILLALVGLDCEPPDLSLLHSWDDRHEPPCIAIIGKRPKEVFALAGLKL